MQDVQLPDGSLIISVLRGGTGFVPKADSVIEAGDQVMLILDPGSNRRSRRSLRQTGWRSPVDRRVTGLEWLSVTSTIC